MITKNNTGLSSLEVERPNFPTVLAACGLKYERGAFTKGDDIHVYVSEDSAGIFKISKSGDLIWSKSLEMPESLEDLFNHNLFQYFDFDGTLDDFKELYRRVVEISNSELEFDEDLLFNAFNCWKEMDTYYVFEGIAIHHFKDQIIIANHSYCFIEDLVQVPKSSNDFLSDDFLEYINWTEADVNEVRLIYKVMKASQTLT